MFLHILYWTCHYIYTFYIEHVIIYAHFILNTSLHIHILYWASHYIYIFYIAHLVVYIVIMLSYIHILYWTCHYTYTIYIEHVIMCTVHILYWACPCRNKFYISYTQFILIDWLSMSVYIQSLYWACQYIYRVYIEHVIIHTQFILMSVSATFDQMRVSYGMSNRTVTLN